ncbi:PREDICTED: inhibin beta chain [Ceratosolen solmsi marchali]|uniref:Inhibin beta chain n=1 Tax=Ceratosolen solmsi marchali TaxID=326594 RepID=A0AAJ6VMB2_9HYME|nr:PREDICTED: inhibin beta chain [Ceratosolen solmsi marchali]
MGGLGEDAFFPLLHSSSSAISSLTAVTSTKEYPFTEISTDPFRIKEGKRDLQLATRALISISSCTNQLIYCRRKKRRETIAGILERDHDLPKQYVLEVEERAKSSSLKVKLVDTSSIRLQKRHHCHHYHRRIEKIKEHDEVEETPPISTYSSKFWSQSGYFAQKLFNYSGPLLHGSFSTLVFLILLSWSLTLCPSVLARQSLHQTCPGCPHQQHTHLHRSTKDSEPNPDDLRLEAIKHQILSKLGLRSRPDVNRTLASVPKRLALETIYRAEAQQAARPSMSEKIMKHHTNNYNRNHPDTYEEYGGGDEYSYKNLEQTGGEVDGTETTHKIPNYQDYDDLYGSPHEPEVMDDFYARTSEIITFAEPGRTLNRQPLLDFPLSSSEPALEPLSIKKATLWARVEVRHAHHSQHHRQNANNHNQRTIKLWVFRVRCGNATHLRGKELGQHLDMITSLVVNIGQLGWQKFDVTRIVADWYQTFNNKDKLTLLIDCTGCGSHVHVSTFGNQSPHIVEPNLNIKNTHDSDRPFLVIRTDPRAVKRVRRRAIECTGAVKGQCCKQRFYVSFSQLGWDDWIIAPQGYYANYCRGDCAAGHRTPDTFPNYYTHVIEEYRKMDRLAGMQPCCAPLKFSPMSLIYYGPDSNIIKRDLPKMVVDECGCP